MKPRLDDFVCIDLDLLTWALERAGDDGNEGCRFDDHHGPEFAAELFVALKEERREFDLLLKR